MNYKDSFVKTINFKPIVDTKGFIQLQKISDNIAKTFKEIKTTVVTTKETSNFKKLLTDTAKAFKKEFREAFLPVELNDFFDKIDEMKEAVKELKDVELQLQRAEENKPKSDLLKEYEQLLLRQKALQNELYEKLAKGEDTSNVRSILNEITSRIEGFEGLFENNPQFEDIKNYLENVGNLKERQEQLKEKTNGESGLGNKLLSAMSERSSDIKQITKSSTVWELIMNIILVVIRKIVKILEKIGKAIIKLFKEALKHLSEMAKYSAKSYIMDSSIREQMLQYGFTPAQNYAFSQASELLGISSPEDLYWGLQTSENFRKKFFKYMDKFSKQFEQQSELAVEYQKFQLEIKELKLELQRDVIQFLVNNKNLIIGFLRTSMLFMKGVMAMLTAIVDFFGGGYKTESERISAASDIITQQSTTNTSNSNVKVDNTYNINGGKTNEITSAIKHSFSTVIYALKGE